MGQIWQGVTKMNATQLRNKKMNEMISREAMIEFILLKLPTMGDGEKTQEDFNQAVREVVEDITDRIEDTLANVTYEEVMAAKKPEVRRSPFGFNESKMKVTKQSLKQMVKEELERVLSRNK